MYKMDSRKRIVDQLTKAKGEVIVLDLGRMKAVSCWEPLKEGRSENFTTNRNGINVTALWTTRNRN